MIIKPQTEPKYMIAQTYYQLLNYSLGKLHAQEIKQESFRAYQVPI